MVPRVVSVCLFGAATVFPVLLQSAHAEAPARVGPASRPADRRPHFYWSVTLSAWSREAEGHIKGDDSQAAIEAIGMAGDLHRGDLLAIALGTGLSGRRSAALICLDDQPLEEQKVALVISLADDGVFPPAVIPPSLAPDWHAFFGDYVAFARSVCTRLGVEISQDGAEFQTREGRDTLRQRLLEFPPRGERQGKG